MSKSTKNVSIGYVSEAYVKLAKEIRTDLGMSVKGFYLLEQPEAVKRHPKFPQLRELIKRELTGEK